MSCLFRSLSFYLTGIDESGLRTQICNYLENNPPLMDDLRIEDILKTEGGDLNRYVQAMRNEATWGGAIEIKAFCELFQVGVEVLVRQTGKYIVFHPKEARTTPLFVRIEWMGNHFEPKPYS